LLGYRNIPFFKMAAIHHLEFVRQILE